MIRNSSGDRVSRKITFQSIKWPGKLRTVDYTQFGRKLGQNTQPVRVLTKTFSLFYIFALLSFFSSLSVVRVRSLVSKPSSYQSRFERVWYASVPASKHHGRTLTLEIYFPETNEPFRSLSINAPITGLALVFASPPRGRGAGEEKAPEEQWMVSRVKLSGIQLIRTNSPDRVPVRCKENISRI